MSKETQREMERRMAAIRRNNPTCADCPAENPPWVSFLLPQRPDDRELGVLCCVRCVQHHHFELGPKRCTIKHLELLHEWIMDDLKVLEYSGNSFVNSFLEGHGVDLDKNTVLAEEEEEDQRRARFIKDKYKKRKYQDEVVHNSNAQPRTRNNNKEEEETASAVVDQGSLSCSLPEQCSGPTSAEEGRRRRTSAPDLGQEKEETNPPRRRRIRSFGRGDEDTTIPDRRRNLCRTTSAPDLGQQLKPRRLRPQKRVASAPDLGQKLKPRRSLRGRKNRSSFGRSLPVVALPKLEMRNRRLCGISKL